MKKWIWKQGNGAHEDSDYSQQTVGSVKERGNVFQFSKKKYHVEAFWVSNIVYDRHFFEKISHLQKTESIGDFLFRWDFRK